MSWDAATGIELLRISTADRASMPIEQRHFVCQYVSFTLLVRLLKASIWPVSPLLAAVDSQRRAAHCSRAHARRAVRQQKAIMDACWASLRALFVVGVQRSTHLAATW